LKNKLSSTSGVNIDEEMAHLLALQNAYSANARVMSTVKDMYTACYRQCEDFMSIDSVSGKTSYNRQRDSQSQKPA